jgi:hypothetical protein
MTEWSGVWELVFVGEEGFLGGVALEVDDLELVGAFWLHDDDADVERLLVGEFIDNADGLLVLVVGDGLAGDSWGAGGDLGGGFELGGQVGGGVLGLENLVAMRADILAVLLANIVDNLVADSARTGDFVFQAELSEQSFEKHATDYDDDDYDDDVKNSAAASFLRLFGRFEWCFRLLHSLYMLHNRAK